jgi:DNA-binding CsgD family transcriptional regulator
MTRKDVRHTGRTDSEPNGAGHALALKVLLGFACNQAFLFSLFYMGYNRFIPVGSGSFERIDVLFSLLFVAAVMLVLRAVSAAVRDVMLSRNLMWCYAVLMAIGSAVLLPDSYGFVSPLIEGLVVGVPLGCMLAAWGRTFTELPHDSSVRGVLLATAIAAVLSFLLYLVSTVCEPVLYVIDVFPFLSAWALHSNLASNTGFAPGENGAVVGASDPFSSLTATNEQRMVASQLSRKALAGSMLFGIAGGMMETYASDPGMVATPTFPATLLLLALLCAGSLQIVGVSRQAQSLPENDASELLVGVYRLIVMVMTAGYLFIPVLKPFGVPGDAIVLAAYLALSAVLISLFILMAKLAGTDGALSFSRGFCALYIGEALGLALGNAFEIISAAADSTYIIASCAGFATLFAYLYLFTEHDFRSLSQVVKQADRFDDACRSIAERCKLSKRESEILPLALRGRTAERMASELFISKSTVDTHLRRIYSKCAVHSRQELIDLGEREIRILADGKES